MRWNQRSLDFRVLTGVPDNVTAEEFAAAARAALIEWNHLGCSDLLVSLSEGKQRHAEPANGINEIELVLSGWSSELGYRSDATGVTDVQFEEQPDGTWAIVEADIRINAEDFRWTATENPGAGERSLLSVVTHEAGHALGLLHPCELGGADGAPTCSEDGHEANESIMYPYYAPSRAELYADDIAGVCHLYPSCETEGCPAGSTCTSDGCFNNCGAAPCGAGEVCVEQRCVAAADCPGPACPECGPDGCPHTCPGGIGCGCHSDGDCRATGACLSSGVCAAPCTSDGECAENDHCVLPASGTGYCGVAGSRGLGEACTGSSDCAGEQCLLGASPAPVCSQACTNESGCPEGWACTEVEGRDVCAPALPEGGCNFSHRGGSESVLASLLALVGFRSLRRRRRSGMRSPS